VWYRGHDLRVEDMPALLAAVQRGGPVVPVFIWAPEEDGMWCLGRPARWWLSRSIVALDRRLRELGCETGLILRRAKSESGGGGGVETTLLEVVKRCGAEAVYWNRVYDPVVLRRDEEVRRRWSKHHHLAVESFKAELLVEPWEVCATESRPASFGDRPLDTFHEFMSAWMAMPPPPEPLPAPKRIEPLTASQPGDQGPLFAVPESTMQPSDVLQSPGGEDTDTEMGIRWNQIHNLGSLEEYWRPGVDCVAERLQDFLTSVFPTYGDARRRQRLRNGTSRLSPYLRFGELSPRRLYHAVRASVLQSEPSDAIIRAARTLLRNLCLREYAYHMLFYRPSILDRPLVPEFDHFPCTKEDVGRLLEVWLSGRTGYPLVDAAMRELHHTGWLHSNLRFLVASFFTKYLLLPWQIGARCLFKLFIDGDLASNAICWQWVTGCNYDVFPLNCLVNPVVMGMRVDPEGEYVRTWCPELQQIPSSYIHAVWKCPPTILHQARVELGVTYPRPVVENRVARRRARDALRYLRQVVLNKRGYGVRVPNTLSLKGTQELMSDWPIDEVYNVLDSKQEDLFGLSDLGHELPSGRQPERPMRDSDASIDDQEITGDSIGGDHVGLLPRVWSMSQDDPLHNVFDLGGSASGANGAQLAGPSPGLGGSNGYAQGPGGGNGGSSLMYGVSAGTFGNQPMALVSSGMGMGSSGVGGGGGGGGGGSDRSIPEVVVGAPSSVDEDSYTEKLHRVDSFHALLSAGATTPLARGSIMEPTGRVPGTNPDFMRAPPMEHLSSLSGIVAPNASHPSSAAHVSTSGSRSLVTAGGAAAALSPGQMMGTLNAAVDPGTTSASPLLLHHTGGAGHGRGSSRGTATLPGSQSQPMGSRSMLNANLPGSVFAFESGEPGAMPRPAPGHSLGPETSVSAPASWALINERPSLSAAEDASVHRRPGAMPASTSTRYDNGEAARYLEDRAGRKRALADEGVCTNPDLTMPERFPAVAAARVTQRLEHDTAGSVSSAAKTKRRASGAAAAPQAPAQQRTRDGSAPNEAPAPGSSALHHDATRAPAGSRWLEQGASGESLDVRSSSASSDRTAPITLEGLGDVEPPQTRSERLELLERIHRSDNAYARFAGFLLQHYDITENVRRNPKSTDFVRLRNLKDHFNRYSAPPRAGQGAAHREPLRIYRIKQFFSKILNLEVTGEWDRHAHGGVRGPYVYGLVLRADALQRAAP